MASNKESLSKNRILIIEDDNGIREILKLALELEGFTIHTAINGQEGIEVLSQIPTPDLILLDLMMPVMNGWEFLENITQNKIYAEIPVLAVTAFSEKSQSIPVKEVIRKPVDLDILLKAVRHWCGIQTNNPPARSKENILRHR